MYKTLKEQHNGEEVLFMTFLKKDGRSYCRHQINPGIYNYTEHCIVFSNPTYEIEYKDLLPAQYNASTVAHELLHLFGAEDYYNDLDRIRLTLQHFPEDIMFMTNADLYANKIGGYTAYSIGWTETKPPICNYPEWYHYINNR